MGHIAEAPTEAKVIILLQIFACSVSIFHRQSVLYLLVGRFQARVIFDLAKAVSFIQQTDSKRWWLGLTDQFRFSPVTQNYETLKL